MTCAGLTEIASELQDSTAKPAADQAGKKQSKAQLAGSSNRKIVSTLASNVIRSPEALAVVQKAASGQGRAMHAAVVTLACAAATADVAHQGMSLPALFPEHALPSVPCHGLHLGGLSAYLYA